MIQLGRGISGIVYQAYSRGTPKKMRAIKKVAKKGIGKEVDQFNEVKRLQEVDHPSIIRLYETYEDENNLYYVTE